MRTPPRLASLLDDGIIDRVLRPLMSGKEAQVYLVESGGALRAAKVYKDADGRSFRNRADYQEGRAVRNSRDRRAMGKRSKHGRERDEAAWKSAEADVIYKLAAAGVPVPKPYGFIDGVLLMQCVVDPNGAPAPRLAECDLDPALARTIYHQLIDGVQRMLCVDIVHGDLSAYNVLLGQDGPIIIDFPQAVNAANNTNAKRILVRDVANLAAALRRGTPVEELRHAYEMWDLYERGELTPDTPLTGRFRLPAHEVDADRLLRQMLELEEDAANAEEEPSAGFIDISPRPARKPDRGRRGGDTGGPQIVVKGKGSSTPEPAPREGDGNGNKRRRRRNRRR